MTGDPGAKPEPYPEWHRSWEREKHEARAEVESALSDIDRAVALVILEEALARRISEIAHHDYEQRWGGDADQAAPGEGR